ncbi:MotA/TolQ/ExbB proton channel family protein [Roseimaritima ulvae]|uniref:MotA/TolQ/ExbB proton channel family protein n=1 Tax=Roseimaritima ulvae TaxID=980254 RepID=A0A5B9QZD6_9BACT|nr:MotA/TolQ/ExbB proton channel family protein [Roseimaritima ulvae]
MVTAISDSPTTHSSGARNPLRTIATRSAGVLVAGVFYLTLHLVPFAPAQRYFLGHPVAIGATILFCIAAVSLLTKWITVRRERRLCEQISDAVLAPNLTSIANQDVGGICSEWLQSLSQLPVAAHGSRLVGRLEELLQRQVRRGNARQLADDLREVSGRDSDDAHDSLQLVRIIVWAIPMLGFLGTVIGITQTLGGLDFSDGTAAVDRLKSGLYVAFDTTALGLVLSVVAIFLQFPVEQAEQQLMALIDRRSGELLAAHLPDPAADGVSGQIATLCEGVLAAVQQSLGTQAELWRETIDGAHQHWQTVVAATGTELSDSIGQAVGSAIGPALANHTSELQHIQQQGVEAIDGRWQQWQLALSDNARILLAHQQTLVRQAELLADSQSRAEELVTLQQTLDQNLERLETVNRSLDQSLNSTAGGEGMSEAVRVLARAVDMLSSQLPASPVSTPTRRAA